MVKKYIVSLSEEERQSLETMTEATLMTLGKHGTATDGNLPLCQADALATDQANHHPN